MDLRETAEDGKFREEVREFLARRLPPTLKAKAYRLQKLTKDELVGWHRILHSQGWGGPAWPVKFGGTGWNVMQQKIFEEECYLAGAPRYVPQINMIGPALHRYGTPEQQAYFLPRLLKLEDWWCQGYSEPGAGSDLTSLTTRARREGDRYIVSGQKAWTTNAPWADWMFALVRTGDGARPADGISFLLIDMNSPGVTARWIKGVDGAGTLAEVFLDNVEVPVANLVHEENKGWAVAKAVLDHERVGQAGFGQCKFLLKLLKRLMSATDANPIGAQSTPARKRRLAVLEIELIAHEWSMLRMLSASKLGVEPSILKNRGAAIQQSLTELMLDCVSSGLVTCGNSSQTADLALEDILPTPFAVAATHLDFRKVSIFAGTTEVQKNIISKAMLA